MNKLILKLKHIFVAKAQIIDLRALEAGSNRNVDPEAVGQKRGVCLEVILTLPW